jgi:carbon storage regulator
VLILSRKTGQSLILTTDAGEVIEVMISDIRSGPTVRVGIEAPKSVQIWRKEVYEEVKKEQKREP